MSIDRMAYEGGIGSGVSTTTGDVSAIEELIETYSGLAAAHPYMPTDEIGNARAELAALRATIEAQAAEEQLHTAWVQMVHRRTVEADKAYNEAHGITAPSMPDLGVLVGWLLDERKAQAEQIETMRAALQAAVDMDAVDDQDILTGMASVVSRAARDALSSAPSTGNHPASPDGSRAVLGNSSGTPNGSPTYQAPDDLDKEIADYAYWTATEDAARLVEGWNKPAWVQAEIAAAIRALDKAPSTVAVVPLERLREIHLCLNHGMDQWQRNQLSAWVAAAIRDAEREKE